METVEISPALLERVDAGIEWANENIPDWREFVNPKTVDIFYGDTCFLGQYWNGKHHTEGDDLGFYYAKESYFGGDGDRTEALGFSYPWTLSGQNYTTLNAAWQRKFRELGLLDD